MDTGGIVFDDRSDVFAEQITHQALVALEDAHAGILVCDGQIGISPLDQSLAAWLRRHARVPIYLAVNKCESTRQETLQIEDFWSLGLGQPYPVSGIHGNGMGDLLDAVVQKLPKVTSVQHENTTNVALVGRPNVGKSSLFNRLYGKERVIVSDVAGTTRDAVDEVIYRDGQAYRLIDTAGIRKKGKVHYGPEFFMVNRAFKAIRRSEVVVLLIDAIQGIVDQDRIIAERIAEEGRACVLVLNKWDAVPNKDDKSYDKAIEHARTVLPVVRWAEVSSRPFPLFRSLSLTPHPCRLWYCLP